MEPALVRPPRALGGRYVWDARLPKGRFRDTTTGRFVSWDAVRSVLDQTLASAEDGLLREAARLQSGEINLAEFQRFFEPEIKRIHLASYALERGGWAQMTQSDYGRLGRILFNPNATSDPNTWGQYQFARRLFEQVADGSQPLDGRFLSRVSLYVKAGRKTYHRAETLYMVQAGYTEERYLLNPADHCTDKDGPLGGCVERAEASWQPVGTYGNIGELNCRANCKCSKQYRNPGTGLVFDPERG